MHTFTQFSEVRALIWAVLVSTFSMGAHLVPTGLAITSFVFPLDAFCIKLDTAAHATSLKSASVAARLVLAPASLLAATCELVMGFFAIIPKALAAAVTVAPFGIILQDITVDGTTCGLTMTW